MTKIKVMVAKGQNLRAITNPYSEGDNEFVLTKGETYDFAIITEPKMVARIENDKSFVYEVITE